MSSADQNALLAALPQRSKKRITSQLRLVDLPSGTVIYEQGQEIGHVYFPVDCIISLICMTLDGHSAEISAVGHEGVVGISIFLGETSATNRAMVYSHGSAFRIPASELRREFDNDPMLRMLMLTYTQGVIDQVAQTAVCNRHHTILQQLCRWLLMSMDRLPSNEVTVTQELIANMLGVRREGITEAAGKLQRQGVIRYRRGHITVIDRPKLEALCCECYVVTERESERLRSCFKHP